jgi:peptide/nickel transport system substrate-binding protein
LDREVKAMLKLAYEEVPRVPLFQPLMDVAMQKNVAGYQFWFHREPDLRQFAKG